LVGKALAKLGALCAALILAGSAHALELTLKSTDGKPVAEAVIALIPATPATAKPLPAVMGQKDTAFVPHIVAVQTGADVVFQNSDITRHHVYSFSPSKKFERTMPTGAEEHVIFDKPGIVAVGCNIHDNMLGYIVVSDTPYFAMSDAAGMADLKNIPDGNYTARLWHERSRAPGGSNDMPVHVTHGSIDGLNAVLDLKPERRSDAAERKAY
jgi:plastocyanin